jgi:hypothetical protein
VVDDPNNNDADFDTRIKELEGQVEKANGRRIIKIEPTPALIAAGVSVAVIPVWLYLGYRIVDGAITVEAVLENIEALLAALAVMTIPAMKIIDKVLDKWLGGSD